MNDTASSSPRPSDAVARRWKSRYRHWATKLDLDTDMGRRNFHGEVKTLADAVEADYLVLVECQNCSRRKQMHPYKILKLGNAILGTPLAGFKCTTCRCSVSVVITCTYRRSGEF